MGLFLKIWLRLILVSGCVIIADQITKYSIKINLALYDNIIVIEKFFNITHIMNPGGAFGFFATQSPEIRKFIFSSRLIFVSLKLLLIRQARIIPVAFGII